MECGEAMASGDRRAVMTDGSGMNETKTTRQTGDAAKPAVETAAGKTATCTTVVKKRKPSFKSLRREHDALLMVRNVLLMIGGAVLLVPIDFTYLGVKLILFVLLTYAAVFNVKSMKEEDEMRGDETSKKNCVWSYVAFTVITLCFAIVTARAGIAATQYQAALDQALDALDKAGLPTIVLK